MSRKKKLKNIVKGKTSNKMYTKVDMPPSHPKAEYIKYAGFNKRDVFLNEEVRVSQRNPRTGRVETRRLTTEDRGMTPQTWYRIITDRSTTGGATGNEKGFKYQGEIYPIDKSDPRRPLPAPPKRV